MALHVFVIKETELEDPQDLRARSRKFLNLTNERKNMSTKTLRKRIALVAVSALGAGVLSVAPANAVAIAVGDFDFTAAAAQPGVCAVTNTDAAGTTVATVVAGSKFKIEDDSDITGGIYISVSGNATIDSASTGFETVTLTSATDSATTNANTVTFKAGSVGTAKISIAASSTAAATDVLSVTIVAACTSGVISLGDSYAAIVTETNATDEAAVATNSTTTGADVVANGGNGFISIALKDAYSAALASDAIIATVTSGDAFVKIGEEADTNSAVPGVGVSKTAVLASTGAKTTIQVVQSVTNKPTTAVVQISYAGTIVATKTIKFQGVAASISIKDVTVGKTGGSGYFRAQVLDAAGNALFSKEVVDDATANSAEAVATITSGVTSSATSAADGDWSTTGDGVFGCTKGGTATLNVKHVVDVTTVVKKSFTIACGGVLDTWTVSTDKAVYAPGEIATVTVTGKDVYGNLVNSNDTLGTIEYSFGGLTAVTAPTSADTFTSAAGAKTYKFSVGTSEGAFVGTFKIAGATDTAAKTVQYKVAGSTGVTNADVLKAIVSLIASINKQIAALQKALLKK
jgi:hypothetical protein